MRIRLSTFILPVLGLIFFLSGCGSAGINGLSGPGLSPSSASASSDSSFQDSDSENSGVASSSSDFSGSAAAPGQDVAQFAPAGAPVDIPVTIAKVTRPNPKMMVIKPHDKGLHIQGLPGAAPAPSQTQTNFCQVMVYDKESGEKTIAPIKEDGSFDVEVKGDYLESELAIAVTDAPIADLLQSDSSMEKVFLEEAIRLDFESANQYRFRLSRGEVVALESVTLEDEAPYLLEARTASVEPGQLASGATLYLRDAEGIARFVAVADFPVDELIPSQYTVVARSGHNFFKLVDDHFERIYRLGDFENYRLSAINPAGRFLMIATDENLFMLNVSSGEVIRLQHFDSEREWVRAATWRSNEDLYITYSHEGDRGLQTEELLLTPDYESESIWAQSWDRARVID